jgi:hypothetical protein
MAKVARWVLGVAVDVILVRGRRGRVGQPFTAFVIKRHACSVVYRLEIVDT